MAGETDARAVPVRRQRHHGTRKLCINSFLSGPLEPVPEGSERLKVAQESEDRQSFEEDRRRFEAFDPL